MIEVKICKFGCNIELGGFDKKENLFRELASGILHTKERCTEVNNNNGNKSESDKQYSTAPPVIGTRKYCNNCKTERIELIDKNGITDHGFKTWRWAQTCDNCKLNDCLEYLPIRLGDSIIDTVNQALSETKKEQEQEQEQPSEPPIQIQKMESMEEWRKAVKTKYDNLEKVVSDNLPSLWLALEFVLSIRSIMNIAGVTLPWFGIILGRASSLKTAAIEILRDTINTFYTDIFTPKAFVSNSMAASKDKLKEIDMLPKIKNKLFLVSELSSMFTKKEEEVQESLGIFTRLADGHGLQTNTGAHGSRGYRDIYFNMVAAAVDIPYKVYKLLGYLGPKLYFIRLPKMAKTEDQYLTEMYADEYPVKFGKVREALNEYLNVFASCPDMQIEEGTNLSRIPWTKNDDRQASRYIVRSALLLSHLRAVVTTFGDTYGHGGTDYAYATAQIEEPSRAITQLRNLARGHALSKGRTHITMEDIPLVIKVALSTAPIDRVNVFDLLIAHKGTLKTSIIEASLNMSDNTAKRTMTELKAIELVDKPKPKATNEELTITLKEAFKWFLTEDFDKLREGFIPTDNSEELEMKKKDERASTNNLPEEKLPPCPIEPESKPKPPVMEECSKCGVKLEAFYLRHSHRCEGTD